MLNEEGYYYAWNSLANDSNGRRDILRISIILGAPHNYGDLSYDEHDHYYECLECGYKARNSHNLSYSIISNPSFDELGLKEIYCKSCDYRSHESLNNSLSGKAVTIKPINTLVYNGLNQIQQIEVYFNTILLEEEKHYTIKDNVNKNAGTHQLRIEGLGGFEGSAKEFEYEIKKAPLNVIVNDAEVTYNEDPSFTLSYEGFLNGETEDVLSGEVEFITEYKKGSSVGTYEVTATGLTASNYDITFVPGTLTVNKAVVNSPSEDITDFIYNGVDQTYNIEANPLYSVTNNVQKHAGDYKVVVSLLVKVTVTVVTEPFFVETTDSIPTPSLPSVPL